MLVRVNEDTFAKEVLEARAPVLANFWAPWCGLCRLVEPILEEFQFQWEDVKLVSINADESLKLASNYRLTTLPTLIWFESGKVLHRLEHFSGRTELRHTLADIACRYSQRSMVFPIPTSDRKISSL